MENKQMTYAGFWKRFLAYIIDQIILGIISIVVIIPLTLFFGLSTYISWEDGRFRDYHHSMNDDLSFATIGVIVIAILTMAIVVTAIKWLYYALMESSARQGTIGKNILSIIVTDTEGNRITFGRATGRFFGKILSELILNIGYLMIAFTEKKQGLHDILANCLVIDKPIFQPEEE